MKKLVLQAVITLVLGFIAHQFLPFWSIAVAAGLVGLLFKYENSGMGFAAGLVAGVLLWGGYAAYLDTANGHLLSGSLGELFSAKGIFLVYFTGLLGGLLGGLGALTGSLARKMLEKSEVSYS